MTICGKQGLPDQILVRDFFFVDDPGPRRNVLVPGRQSRGPRRVVRKRLASLPPFLLS